MSLRGFATINFWADDVPAAAAWYAAFLRVQPYYSMDGPDGRPAHVDDLEATLASLVSMGATAYQQITPHGDGFTTASVLDPFGNVLGTMRNSHYLDVLEGGQRA